MRSYFDFRPPERVRRTRRQCEKSNHIDFLHQEKRASLRYRLAQWLSESVFKIRTVERTSVFVEVVVTKAIEINLYIPRLMYFGILTSFDKGLC